MVSAAVLVALVLAVESAGASSARASSASPACKLSVAAPTFAFRNPGGMVHMSATFRCARPITAIWQLVFVDPSGPGITYSLAVPHLFRANRVYSAAGVTDCGGDHRPSYVQLSLLRSPAIVVAKARSQVVKSHCS
jgi:hypothetical protein